LRGYPEREKKKSRGKRRAALGVFHIKNNPIQAGL
jgi:hypothetical protein